MEKNELINELVNQWHNEYTNQSNRVECFEVRQWLERQKEPEPRVGEVWLVVDRDLPHEGVTFRVFLYKYQPHYELSGVDVRGRAVDLDKVEFKERLLRIY